MGSKLRQADPSRIASRSIRAPSSSATVVLTGSSAKYQQQMCSVLLRSLGCRGGSGVVALLTDKIGHEV